jgi:hypothetical protein
MLASQDLSLEMMLKHGEKFVQTKDVILWGLLNDGASFATFHWR